MVKETLKKKQIEAVTNPYSLLSPTELSKKLLAVQDPTEPSYNQ